MAKLVLMFATAAIAAFKTSSGTDYSADEDVNEDGLWEIHPEHVEEAQLHGFVFPTAEHGHLIVGETLRIPSDFDDAIAAKDSAIADRDAEIAELKRQLAEKGTEKTSDAPGATDTPPGGGDASGDTSEKSGGGSEPDKTTDVIGDALALNPDFDAMDRDAAVEWLNGVGVAIAKNVSTDVAKKAIEDTVADYKASKEG